MLLIPFYCQKNKTEKKRTIVWYEGEGEEVGLIVIAAGLRKLKRKA